MNVTRSYYLSGHHCGPHRVSQRRERGYWPYIRPPPHDDLILTTAQQLAGLDEVMTGGPALQLDGVEDGVGEGRGADEEGSFGGEACVGGGGGD